MKDMVQCWIMLAAGQPQGIIPVSQTGFPYYATGPGDHKGSPLLCYADKLLGEGEIHLIEDTRKARQKQPKKDIPTRESFQSGIPLFHSEELFFGQPEGFFL